MPGEEVVDLRHRWETPCKYPPLQSECSSHHTTGRAGQLLGWRLELVNLMWISNCHPPKTRPTLQRWLVREPQQSRRLPPTTKLLRSKTLLLHWCLTQKLCRLVCTPHQTGGSDYAGRHLFGCGSGSTCSTGSCGCVWGYVLGVSLIIRANDHVGRRGDRL